MISNVSYFYGRKNLPVARAEEPEPSVFEEMLKPLYTKPVSVSFVSKEIDVIPLGVDANGRMQTPKDWFKAGWYMGSAKPGEVGNMVINGHFDTNFGAPAAFWMLKNLKAGDKVLVTDKFGKVHTYSVTKSFFIEISDPDRLEILKDSVDKRELTLITCGGVWIPESNTYNRRLVVKAEL